MIPYKLRLQNFLSYRGDQDPLDFHGMHLVCLIGENGHGKSALLDGITWALWGKARAKSDDELMHMGSSDMQVEFEFGLEGQSYNVVRKRFRSGRSMRSDLQVAIWDGSSRSWQALTENTMRTTQERINAILRMDYETFINSAFLKQGEADAFTSKTSSQRKDILGTILGLSRYDAYADLAKDRAKDAALRGELIDRELATMAAEIARRPQYEEEERSAALRTHQAELDRQAADHALAEAQRLVQDLQSKGASLTDLRRRLEETRSFLEDTLNQRRAAEEKLADVEATLAQRPVIEDNMRDWQTAYAAEKHWGEVLQSLRPLNERERDLQIAMQAEAARLERELMLAQRELAEAETRVQALPAFSEELDNVNAKVAAITELETIQQQRTTQLGELRAEIGQIKGELAAIQDEGQNLRQRLLVLASGETSLCPVCKQPLGAEGRHHLVQEYEQQRQGLRDRYGELQGLEKEKEDAVAALKQGIARAQHDLNVKAALMRQLGELQTRQKEALSAQERLPGLQDRVQALQAQLEGDYAPDLRTGLAEVEAQIAELAYDQVAHDRARAMLSDLRDAERQHARLQQAVSEQEGLRQQLDSLTERERRQTQIIDQDQEKVDALAQAVAELPTVQDRLKRAGEERVKSYEQWQQAHGQLVTTQQRLKHCNDLVSTRQQKQQELDSVKHEASNYRQLQEAFGPKGVQAMIIEAALPELEGEANRLLARLSDGRMHVRLQTQRELKTGGTQETLDIIISDELGSRPYELYSGGEAFRVDLAIRIALSRLLARRAGAALQTLFLDEGFGTQDAQGRENLVEALHVIQDEFALVLVITHIDELKEQFPVRIHVTKDEISGSHYTVL